jgi:hypothetical protein
MLRAMQPALAFGLVTALGLACGIALFQEPRTAPPPLADAAAAFLAALPPELQKRASAPFDEQVQHQWHYVPQDYPGVMFGDLDAAQRARAMALLQAVLSARGIGKVEAIMALEDVLAELERGHGGPTRDPKRYWLQVLGTPKADSAWAFRLQGHHVSLHFAAIGSRLVGATPMFLGANPHEVPSGPHAGERVLGREEDLARGLLALLTDEQRTRATIAAKAPADIVLGPARPADGLGAPQGLPYSAMDPLQQQMLLRLVDEFVQNRSRESADAEWQRIRAHGLDGICFAWAGGTGRTQGHYFRIHGPLFVIEYDNTQNDANHVHTVWRDLEHDFGGDPLREHYAREHGLPAHDK